MQSISYSSELTVEEMGVPFLFSDVTKEGVLIGG